MDCLVVYSGTKLLPLQSSDDLHVKYRGCFLVLVVLQSTSVGTVCCFITSKTVLYWICRKMSAIGVYQGSFTLLFFILDALYYIDVTLSYTVQ